MTAEECSCSKSASSDREGERGLEVLDNLPGVTAGPAAALQNQRDPAAPTRSLLLLMASFFSYALYFKRPFLKSRKFGLIL
jgi:hypothetical protein